jgi:hypothetical protein
VSVYPGFLLDAATCARVVRISWVCARAGDDCDSSQWAAQYRRRSANGIKSMMREFRMKCHGDAVWYCDICGPMFENFVRLSHEGKL